MPTRKRSAEVIKVIEKSVDCCKEPYNKKQKVAWQLSLSLHHFLKRAESCQYTGSARQLVQPDHAPQSPAFSNSSD
jgi:hypothetical protein